MAHVEFQALTPGSGSFKFRPCHDGFGWHRHRQMVPV